MQANYKPPRFAQKVLLSFLREDISEEVQGDLEELFFSNLEKSTPSRARLNYWYQVLNYLRPFAIKKFKSIYSNYLTMYQHDIKIGWRNLTKQKMYSAIKIGGLGMGIAACLLIALYIKEELSYDQSSPDASRIYRIVGRATENGVIDKWVSFPAPMAKVMLKDFPEIEISARLMPNSLFPRTGHWDNRLDWVIEFVNDMQEEIVAAIKEPISVYFDTNPHYGLSETNDVDDSLKEKLKCL